MNYITDSDRKLWNNMSKEEKDACIIQAKSIQI